MIWLPFPCACLAGGVLAVLGAAGSGKLVVPAYGPGPQSCDGGLAVSRPLAEPGRLLGGNARRGRSRAGSPKDEVLLVDDADLLPAATRQQLLELNALGWTVIMAAGFGPGIMQRVPLALAARTCGSGILIGPRSPMDGDLFGVRYRAGTEPSPGTRRPRRGRQGRAVQLAPVPSTVGPRPDTGRSGTQSAGGAPAAREASG